MSTEMFQGVKQQWWKSTEILRLHQGSQTQFHRGPHQHYGCTQRAGCNFKIYTNKYINISYIYKIMYYITLFSSALDHYRIG